jgi:hypothetical protein
MKKFALFAMLLTAGVLTLGCSEKKKEAPKGDTPAATTTEGEKPAEPAK